MSQNERGFTLVELVVGITILSMASIGFFGLLISLTQSALVAKRQAVALTMATSQMEYLKSLPYNNLAVVGGAIPATSPLPAQSTKVTNGEKYITKTSISYADDSFDGCGSYPTLALKTQYCRNYPAPASAPATDTNPADYKDVSVVVTDESGLVLASVDTNISALVAETASNTGAIFVRVVDASGNPVEQSAVNITNTATTPAVNVNDTTDQNGIVIFYGLPPSTASYRYVITASADQYSTLTTIAPSGSLQPTYPSQNLIAQNSSFVTMAIYPQGQNSLIIETTDTSGAPLTNAKVYVKGGYKKYTGTVDTTYYYDTLTPSDTRPVSNASGLAVLNNLVPGSYKFCGDAGATSCSVGGTTYYLAAALPYGGTNPFNPIAVPSYDPANPPSTTFDYSGTAYLQKVRLMLTSNASFPRISSMTPYDASLTGGTINNVTFTVSGTNLPCSSTASSCSTAVSFVQGATTYVASCTGASSGISLSCKVNLTGAVAGNTQMIIKVGSYTLSLPAGPPLGGFVVSP
ncbi:MAG: hypothetical protein JWM81_518 [Candidatus Saccharibacteria bacterium]|nr:hypothetical protein [Candidatus Saccharibacteria bacterium]